jgi:hypothetical protein
MGDFSMTRAEAIRNHYRGLADAGGVVPAFDQYGNPYWVQSGTDPAGNPMIASENTPYWYYLTSQGIQAANNYFGGRGRRGGGYDSELQAALIANANRSGASFGISTEVLIIGGIILAVFFLGKRGRG